MIAAKQVLVKIENVLDYFQINNGYEYTIFDVTLCDILHLQIAASSQQRA